MTAGMRLHRGFNASDGYLAFSTSGVERVTVDYNGSVGIGTTSPNYMLDVRGAIGNNATLYHSDRRWKRDIVTLTDALAKLQELRGVRFDWNRDEFPDMNFAEGQQIGLIAQEVEEVVPEIVDTDQDGYKSVDYSKLVALLIEANKEQQKQIRELSALVHQLADQKQGHPATLGLK